MNLPCSVVGDLLPLYAAHMTAPETSALIRSHLSACPQCQKQLASIQSAPPAAAAPTAPLGKLRREIRRRRRLAALLAASLICTVLVTLFSWFTTPIYLPYTQDLLTIAQTGETLSVTLNQSVAGYRLTDLTGPDGQTLLVLEAWRTRWPFGIRQNVQFFLPAERAAPGLYYCDNTQSGQLTWLWGRQFSGGGNILPRLSLGYYGIIAGGLALILGLCGLLLRKRRKLLLRLALAPAAYLAGHILVMGLSFSAVDPARTLVLIVLAAAGVYGTVYAGCQLLAIRKKDISPPAEA